MSDDRFLQAVWQAIDGLRGEVRSDDLPIVLGSALAAEHASAKGLGLPEAIAAPAASVLGDKSELILNHVRQQFASIAVDDSDRLILWNQYIEFTSDQQGMRGEHTSSRSVTELAVAALAGMERKMPASPAVWDPCAGSGILAVSVALRLRNKGFHPRLILWDVNRTAVHSAAVSAFLSDIPAAVEHRDLLTWDPRNEPLSADIVVADPPMGLMWDRQREAVARLASEGNYAWGLPRVSDGTWLIFQQLIAGMASAARGLVFSSLGPLFNGDSNDIRRHFIDFDVLRAIAYLPEGTATNTQIERCALLLDGHKPDKLRGHATLVNLKDLFRASLPHSRQPKVLLPEAVTEFEKAISNPKPTRISRTVPTSDFELKEVKVFYPRLDSHNHASTLHRIPAAWDTEKWARNRYGSNHAVVAEASNRVLIDMSPTAAFGKRRLTSLPLGHARLSSLVTALLIRPVERSPQADVREVGAAHQGPWVTESRGQFVVQQEPPSSMSGDGPNDEPSATWSYAFQLDTTLDPHFLVRFMQTQAHTMEPQQTGRVARLVSSLGQALKALDHSVVPVPSLDRQVATIAILDKLELVQAQQQSDIQAIWAGAESARELNDRIDSYLGHEELVDRLRRWPNPIASAGWVVQTTEMVPESQERALLRFWEAVSGFHATILLSAIKHIPDLEDVTLKTIRDGVARAQNLSLAEASVGTFSLISSTCANQIRGRLHESIRNPPSPEQPPDDPMYNSDIEQIISAFGGLKLNLIEQLISRDIARLFEELRPLRTPGAHGGLETSHQLRQRVSRMRELMLQWDSITRRVWTDYILVRGGSLDRFEDHYEQEVEYVIGNDYPFLRGKVRTLDGMKSGHLCMYSVGSANFMEIRAPLFEFLEVPEEAKIACYYFNRLRGSDLDLKSFVYPGEVQGPSVSPGIGQTVQWLIGNPTQL